MYIIKTLVDVFIFFFKELQSTNIMLSCTWDSQPFMNLNNNENCLSKTQKPHHQDVYKFVHDLNSCVEC